MAYLIALTYFLSLSVGNQVGPIGFEPDSICLAESGVTEYDVQVCQTTTNLWY